MGENQLDFGAIRQYLAQNARKDMEAVLQDAAIFKDPGAVALLDFLLRLRVNRRSRRTLEEVEHACTVAQRPRWLTVLQKNLWNLYRLALSQLFCVLFDFISL